MGALSARGSSFPRCVSARAFARRPGLTLFPLCDGIRGEVKRQKRETPRLPPRKSQVPTGRTGEDPKSSAPRYREEGRQHARTGGGGRWLGDGELDQDARAEELSGRGGERIAKGRGVDEDAKDGGTNRATNRGGGCPACFRSHLRRSTQRLLFIDDISSFQRDLGLHVSDFSTLCRSSKPRFFSSLSPNWTFLAPGVQCADASPVASCASRFSPCASGRRGPERLSRTTPSWRLSSSSSHLSPHTSLEDAASSFSSSFSSSVYRSPSSSRSSSLSAASLQPGSSASLSQVPPGVSVSSELSSPRSWLLSPAFSRSLLSCSLSKFSSRSSRRRSSPVSYPLGLLPSDAPTPGARADVSSSPSPASLSSSLSSSLAASRPSFHKRLKDVRKVDRHVQARVVQLGLGAPRNTGEKRQQILHGDRSLSARCPVFLGQLKPRLEKWRTALREEELPPPTLPEIAFAGRSNVGKSSLLNELAGRRLTSLVTSRPGTTQQLHFFKAGSPPVLCLVDLPGYGFAKAAAATRLQWTEFSLYYLKTRKNLRRVFVLVDARHGLKESDKEMLHFLHRWGVSWQIVLTKADLVKPKDLVKTLMLVKEDAKAFRHQAADPIAVSALRHQALDVLRREMDELKIDKEIVKHGIRVRIHSKLEERRLRRQLKAAKKKAAKGQERREEETERLLTQPSVWAMTAGKGAHVDSQQTVDGTEPDSSSIVERARRRWNLDESSSQGGATSENVDSEHLRERGGSEDTGDKEQLSLDAFIECTEVGRGSWHHRHSLETTEELLLSASSAFSESPPLAANADSREEATHALKDGWNSEGESPQLLGRKRSRRRASGRLPSSRQEEPFLSPSPAFFAAADAAAELALGLSPSGSKEDGTRRGESASRESLDSGGKAEPREGVSRNAPMSPLSSLSAVSPPSSVLASSPPVVDVHAGVSSLVRGEDYDGQRPPPSSVAVNFDLSGCPEVSRQSVSDASEEREEVESKGGGEGTQTMRTSSYETEGRFPLQLSRHAPKSEDKGQPDQSEFPFLTDASSSELDSLLSSESLDDDEDPSCVLHRSMQGFRASASSSQRESLLSRAASVRLRRAVEETKEICQSHWRAERMGKTSVAFELTEKASSAAEEDENDDESPSSSFPSLAAARQAASARKRQTTSGVSPRLSGVALGQKGDVLLLEDAGSHTGGGASAAGRRGRHQRRNLAGEESGGFGLADPLEQAPEPGRYTGDYERDMRQSWDRRKRMELDDLGNIPARPLRLDSRSSEELQRPAERPRPFWRRRKEADAAALSAEAGFIGLDPKALQRPVRGIQKRKLLRRLSRMRLHHLRLQPESVSKRLVASVGKEAKADFTAPGIIAKEEHKKGGKNYTWEEAMRKWKRWARKHKADAAVYGRPNKRQLLEEQMQMVERKLFRQRVAMTKKERNEAPGAGLVREFKRRKREARELARGLEASQNGSSHGSVAVKTKKQSPRSRRLQRKNEKKLAELEAFREWKIQQDNRRRGR
ncbi:ribosome biogenesis GTP-binding protein YsxC protein [Toxoplasma gondii GT1]|uniref:Ribosome biogenesis GTP-binding protein YsxC protein n=2 Tax=Toxoplasma gondii TaxID=5811 RepID=S7WF40_TOXGG|nr:ribosome biogenesis GTP-binding protein YsxC protein [Toxoplasma gondii GT1]KAF4641438.1 ribosome biogenesis GTP-binding protein YsxC protein [Toxoplasma gondii]